MDFQAIQNLKQRARSASPTNKTDSLKIWEINTVSNGSRQTSSPETAIKNAFSTSAQPSGSTAVSFSSIIGDAEHKFRPQNATERNTILEKAASKGRLSDIFIASSHYPQDPGMLKLALSEGKLLIVRQNDLVLAVNREVPSMWLCYNGYYNAMLPSSILRPYSPIETGVDVVTTISSSTAPAQSSATNSVQKSQNLIDLEDLFGQTAPTTTPAITATSSEIQFTVAPFQPVTTSITNWDAAAKTLPLAPAPPPAVVPFIEPIKFSDPPQQSNGGVNYNLNDDDLFSGLASIDWGSTDKTSVSQVIYNSDAQQTTSPPVSAFRGIDCQTGLFNPNSLPEEAPPPLPVIVNPSLELRQSSNIMNSESGSGSFKFPVSFDDSPTMNLPPPIGNQKRSASAAAQPTNFWPMSTLARFEITRNCLNLEFFRSDSPQPLIPSRPEPTVKNNVYPVIPDFNASVNYQGGG